MYKRFEKEWTSSPYGPSGMAWPFLVSIYIPDACAWRFASQVPSSSGCFLPETALAADVQFESRQTSCQRRGCGKPRIRQPNAVCLGRNTERPRISPALTPAYAGTSGLFPRQQRQVTAKDRGKGVEGSQRPTAPKHPYRVLLYDTGSS